MSSTKISKTQRNILSDMANGRTSLTDVHPNTIDALMFRGLIECPGGRTWTLDETFEITDAGRAALEA